MRSRTHRKKYKRNRSIKSKAKYKKGMRGGGVSQSSIPVFIISWNQHTYVKSMVEQLKKYPDLKIYIIDNKSTYEPLVAYLKEVDGKNGVKVLYQDNNYGHKVHETPHILKFIDELGVKYYVVTDPDLKLNDTMPANFLEIMAELSDKYKTNKIGLALDIKNNIDMDRRLKSDGNRKITDIEDPYWTKRVPDDKYEIYDAPVDTTFSLINKQYRKIGDLSSSMRIAGDFIAVHRPWLKNFRDELAPGELDFYLNNGNKSTTIRDWNHVP
jgi:thioredoxin-related protein